MSIGWIRRSSHLFSRSETSHRVSIARSICIRRRIGLLTGRPVPISSGAYNSPLRAAGSVAARNCGSAPACADWPSVRVARRRAVRAVPESRTVTSGWSWPLPDMRPGLLPVPPQNRTGGAIRVRSGSSRAWPVRERESRVDRYRIDADPVPGDVRSSRQPALSHGGRASLRRAHALPGWAAGRVGCCRPHGGRGRPRDSAVRRTR